MSRLGRRILLIVLLGIVLYAVIVVLRGFDSVAARLDAFAWWTFAAACGLALSNYFLRFLKWEYYLACLNIRGIPKTESFLTFLSGFVLTITPGKMGEVFKSLVLYQLRRVPIVRTAPIVIAERVTDLIGVIVIIAVGSLSFPGGIFWAAAGLAVVFLLLVFIASRTFSNGFVNFLPRLPGMLGRLGSTLSPKLEQALGELRCLTAPSQLVWPTILSIVAWSLEGMGLWVILHGFSERPPLALAAFFYATATLAGALIPVPGGLGVAEKLLEEQMAHLGGVSGATSTAAMLLVRLATLWFAVVVGFIALGILRLRFPGLLAGAQGSATGADPSADVGSTGKT